MLILKKQNIKVGRESCCTIWEAPTCVKGKKKKLVLDVPMGLHWGWIEETAAVNTAQCEQGF